MPTTQKTPVEIDTELAELHGARQTLASRIHSLEDSVKRMAGATYYYCGRQRVTDMTFPQAREILVAELANHDSDDHGYGRLSTSRSSSTGQARNALAEIETAEKQLADVTGRTRELNDLYTGWNRFFVVTSSNGHIHSSMNCSTCRYTTTFGWLPSLSDKSQAEAIEHFGPAAECLCSVCFPDAPVAKDLNLTQAQTTALLEGRTPEATVAKAKCSGSGQQATDIRPNRRYGKCPGCGQMMGISTYGKVRPHKPKAEAGR